MIDIDKYEDAKKMVEDAGLIDDNDGWLDVHYRKIAHLLAEVERLQKELRIEQQIVQAFYEYRDDCCFDHCETWMLEKGHRVMVDGLSEWAADTDFFTERDWKDYADSLYEALVRAIEWGHKRCSTQELMDKFDNYVWGEEE